MSGYNQIFIITTEGFTVFLNGKRIRTTEVDFDKISSSKTGMMIYFLSGI